MQSPRKVAQQGFTLIELVVVIVIIGILAAFAIPRFSNIATDARTSSVNGLLGSVRSTAALVHGLALARSTVNGATIALEGNNVVIQNGYPDGTATGIVLALSTTAGYNLVYPTATSVRFEVAGGSDQTKCMVLYTQAAANSAPAITSDVTGC